MLLCRSPLLPGESLPSLLIRLAKLNYYLPRLLPQLCLADVPGYRAEHPTQPAFFQRLADLTQLDPLQLCQATRHVFAPILTPPGPEPERLTLSGGETILLLRRRLVKQHGHPDTAVQFCPHCLQEAAYHRLIWFPLVVTACLKHHCLLLKECPTCHRPLSIRDIVDTHCRQCRTDLRQAMTSDLQCDTTGLLAQQIIQAWLIGSTPPELLKVKLPVQSRQVLYHLLAGLCSTIRPIQDNWPYWHQVGDPIPQPAPTLASYLVATTALKAMTNWPTGFYEFLEAYRYRHGEPSCRDLSTEWGDFRHTWLRKRWQHPSFQFIRDVFDQYLLYYYPQSIPVPPSLPDSSNPTLTSKCTLIPLPQAAQLLKVQPFFLEWMIQSGNLTGYEARENSLPFPLLKRTDVLALGQQKGIFLSVAQTAQRLGTSPQIVISMIKLGLLETEPLSEANNWLITDKSIQHCLYKLAGLMEHPVVTRLKSTIDLAMAAKMLARVGLNEADLVRGILDGQVKSYCHQLYLQDLRQLVFTKSDIIAYVRKTKNREHCSMNDDQFG